MERKLEVVPKRKQALWDLFFFVFFFGSAMKMVGGEGKLEECFDISSLPKTNGLSPKKINGWSVQMTCFFWDFVF